MNRRVLSGVTILLVVLGIILAIWGKIVTATSGHSVTHHVFPIWSSPEPAGGVSITTNYALNFVGLGLLVVAIAMFLASRRSGSKPSVPAEAE